MASSAVLLRIATVRLNVLHHYAACVSRAAQPNARQGKAATTRRPSPLQYAKSQAVVSPRLYASLLANPRNRFDTKGLHALLDDWKVRCPHSLQNDVAIVMTAAAGAAARVGLPAVGIELLEQVLSKFL